MSVSGLANILKEVRDHGMPKQIGRSSIKRARDAEMPQDIFTTVELDMLNGSQRKFPAVDPSVQLQHLASTNEGFGEFLLSKLEMHPSDADHAWKIAIYSDEITPGNPLVANKRKLVCFYFSFAEFDAALGSETLWFHLMSLRSIHLEQIKGGWSQVFEKACRLFFRSPLDMSLGLTLRPKGCDVRLLFARIGLVIGDEQALKMCFGFKGASGMKCCALCMNITLRHLQVAAHDNSNWMVPHTETDISKMVFATSQSILDNVAALEAKAGRTSKAKFEKMEMSLGLNHVPEGRLQGQQFDVPVLCVAYFVNSDPTSQFNDLSSFTCLTLVQCQCETLPTLVVGVLWCLCFVFGVWWCFGGCFCVGFLVFGLLPLPTRRVSILSHDDLGTPPTWRPYSCKNCIFG